MPDNTITDLPRNLFDNFKERLGNPICCAFIISWLIVNWRLVVFLSLSKLTIIQRIEVIDEIYLDSWKNIWFPLLCSTIYLLLMPWLLAGYKWVVGFATTLSQQFVNYHKGKQLDNAIPIAEKECTLALKRSGKTEVEELRKENSALKNKNEELMRTINEYSELQIESSNKNTKQAEQINKLLGTNKDLTEKNASLKKSTTELELKNANLKDQYKKLEDDISYYEEQQKDSTPTLNKMTSDLDNAIEANVALKQKNEYLFAEIRSLTNERDGLLRKLEEVTYAFDELEKKISKR